MVINGVFPFCELCMSYFPLWFARRIDRSWGSDTYKTKLSSMQVYIDIYSGPNYLIHFKYSGLMNITFVTFMYGIGVPLLFPLAAFSYFILYTLERILTSYYY